MTLGVAPCFSRFATFNADLPVIAESFDLKVEELTFFNYVNIASGWLKRDLVADPTA